MHPFAGATRVPQRPFALVLGLIYGALAVWGYTSDVAALTDLHNVVHLVPAVVWLLGAASGRTAGLANLAVGLWLIAFGLLGAFGVVAVDPYEGFAGLVDDVLHLMTGVASILWARQGVLAARRNPAAH